VDGILGVDNQGQVTHANQKFLDLVGLTQADRLPLAPATLTQTQSDRPPSARLAQIQTYLANPARGWHRLLIPWNPLATAPYQEIVCEDGRVFECHVQQQSLGTQIIGQVWSLREVTEHRRAATLIYHQAHHDMLTGLANRAQFTHQLTERLAPAPAASLSRSTPLSPPSAASAANLSSGLALMFVDLDYFKRVNDTLGHTVGDLLLQEFVARLRGCCRSEDLVARWGGDEFTVLVPEVRDSRLVSAIAQRFLDSLRVPFDLEGHSLSVTASIGIALYPQDGHTLNELLKRADMALYHVKAMGRNGFCYYSQTLRSAGELDDPPRLEPCRPRANVEPVLGQ
jgi:diguanylate cyclase (GGDEF)-like protein